MKKNKMNKKKKIIAATCLALLAAGAGTFAWISSQDQRINRVKAAAIKDGSVTVSEVWNPKPIIPGTKATKEVSVTNSGNSEIFVRVSYEEVLTFLTSKGAVTLQDAGWKKSDKPTLKDDVPVEYDAEKYLDPDKGYTEITKEKVDNLPENVRVFAKGSVTLDPVSKAEEVSLDAVAFYEYEDGKYQAMDYNIDVIDGATNGSEVSTWEFAINSIKYKVYADGYTNVVSNWAASSLEGASEDATAAKASLLGSSGKKYDTKYDYTKEGLDIKDLPAPTPATAADQIPTSGNDVKAVQTDTNANALGVSGINIEYGDDIVTTVTLDKNKWVYNKDDGYFYYTSPVVGGDSTTTLMKNLIFTNEVGTEFTNANYDLIVKMESIQATKAALLDSAGWNLGEAADASETKKIVSYLDGQAAS
ncbi:hypothetical protein ACYSNW_14930 [Enterococcus sp. LJL99]